MSQHLPRLLSVGILCVFSSFTLHAQLTDRTWQGAASSNWNVAGNWSGGIADTNTERAVINNSLSGGSPVIYNVGTSTFGGLDIASGFTLTRAAADTTSRSIILNAATATDTYFKNAGTLSTGGTSGTFTLNIAQTAGTVINTGIIEASTGTELVFRPSSTNTLSLTNTGGTFRTVGSGTLTLGLSSTGAVFITGGNLQNPAGTINQAKAATLTDVTATNGGTYTIETVTNTGNPWGLTLAGTTSFTNSGTLNILRDFDSASAGSQSNTFNISSASASLSNSSTGTINIIAVGTPLSGSATANLTFNANTTLANNGTINIESRSTTNAARILVGSGVTATLSGTGELVMAVGSGGSVGQVQLAGGSGSTLINSAGHTIRGAGQLGNNTLDNLTNAGTINADHATGVLTLDLRGTTTTGALTNSGTLRASGAAGMVIVNGSLANTGTVRVDSGSSLTIQDGTFTGTAGTIKVDGTLANTPDLSISGGALTGQGSITGNVTIGGAVQFTPGGTTTNTLAIGGNLVFSPAGSLQTQSFFFNKSSALLSVGGALTQGANNPFQFTFDSSANYAAATAYSLFTMTGGTDLNLNTLSLSTASISAGYVLDSTFGTNGWLLSGNNLQVRFSSVAAAIPEPSNLALLFGLCGCIAFVCRRSRPCAA